MNPSVISPKASFDSDVNINVNDDGASGTASAEGGFSTEFTSSRGYGIEFELTGQAIATAEVTEENGITTFTATGDVSITVGGGVSVPQGNLTGSYTAGIRGEYTVSMPTEEATPEEMATASPFNPLDTPVGTTIQMDGENYQGTEMQATFRAISSSGNVETSAGTSFVVEHTSEGIVTVMTGPTEGLSTGSSLGLEIGPVSGSIGADTSIENVRYQVAEFDLSTPAGQAAYNHFLLTGEMPTQNGDGVSNVHTISTVNTDWTSTASGSLGPLNGSVQLDSSEGEYVTITYPDGSMEATATYRGTDGGPTTVWHQSFDANGNEIIDQRRYDFVFDIPDTAEGGEVAGYLNMALTGDPLHGPVEPGQQVTLTFTESEMQQLLDTASQQSQQQQVDDEYSFPNEITEPEIGSNIGDHSDVRPATAWEFANNLVDGGGDWKGENIWSVALAFSKIATHAESVTGVLGERTPMQATVTIDGEVVIAGEAAAEPEASQPQEQVAYSGGGRPMLMY